MSFWSNPVKAIESWFRILEHILPPPVYAWVKKLLSDEAKLVAQLAVADFPLILSGEKNIGQLGDELAAQVPTLALNDVKDIIRTEYAYFVAQQPVVTAPQPDATQNG